VAAGRGAVGDRGRERPVAGAQQHVHVRADDHEVELPVAVEVTGRGVDRVGSGGEIDPWRERAVGVGNQDADRPGERLADDSHIVPGRRR